MARVLDAVTGWARRTSAFFSEWLPDAKAPADSHPAPQHPGELIYRLRHWPRLPASWRTADVLRLLSSLSHRPLTRSWMLAHTPLTPQRLEALLQRLTAQGALEVIDPRSFPAEHPPR